MTRLFRIGPVAVACVLLGACGQILGLGSYDEVEASAGKPATGGHGGAGGRAGGGMAGIAGIAGKPSGGMAGTLAQGGAAGESPAGAGGKEEGEAGMGGTPSAAGGGGSGGCSSTVEITLHDPPTLYDNIDPTLDFSYYSYEYNLDPQLDTAASDYFWLDFYTGGEYDGGATGPFQLGTGVDANYASCSRCVWLGVDVGDSGAAKSLFYAKSGRLDIAADSDQLHGSPDLELTDVLLSEITLDPDTHVSTEVPGGRCLHLKSAKLVITHAAPDGWTCPAYAYGGGADDGCDCGCGIPDPDCASTLVGACDYCDDENGCGVTDCSNITLTDNSTCTSANQGWACDPVIYGDGSVCDCGCGIVDADCPGAEALYCNLCNDPKSCTSSHTGTCTDIDATDNSKCM